ncbi:hypothetical protein GW17_00060852 [Ensete ventricosum]|nr:hypothetical protein GW17_00060852 [Ensete ventricosum]
MALGSCTILKLSVSRCGKTRTAWYIPKEEEEEEEEEEKKKKKKRRRSTSHCPSSDSARGSPASRRCSSAVAARVALASSPVGESSRRLSGVCQDGAREFARRRPRLTGRLLGVAKKLAGNDGPRSSLSIGSGFGRYSGISPEFTRRFAEGIGKLAGNMSGDCRKNTIGLIVRMSEATGLTGVRS